MRDIEFVSEEQNYETQAEKEGYYYTDINGIGFEGMDVFNSENWM
jgi:hypothetical protein